MPIGDVGVIGSATGRNFDDALAAAAGYAASSHADAISAAASAAAANPAAFYASLPAAMRNQLDGFFPSVVVDVGRSQQMMSGAAAPTDLSSLFLRYGGSKRVIGPTGTLDTVAANSPAFDWSSGRRRLLIEAAGATNRLFYGQSPGVGGSWTLRGVSVTTGVADPAGGTTATQVTLGAASAKDMYNAYAAGFGASARCEPSISMRRVSTSGTIVMRNPSGSSSIGWWVVDVSKLGPGWERVTRSHPSVTVTYEFSSTSAGDAGIWLFSGDGSDVTVQLWAAQQEAGTASTSVVLTPSNAAVTRIVDDEREATAVAAITTASTSSGAICGSATGTGDLVILGGASAAVKYNPTTGVATLTDGTHALTCAGTPGADFGIAWSVSPAGRTLAVQGCATVSTDAYGLFTVGESIRLGSLVGGGSPAPSVSIDERAAWLFAGSAAGVKTLARVYA